MEEETSKVQEESQHEELKMEPAAKAGGKRVRRRKRKYNKGYPTKNFLVGFKKAHLGVLEQAFGPKIYNHELVKGIKGKNGINMKELEKLYNEPEFRPCFQEYFKSKQIYRDLQQLRTTVHTKLIYLAKVHVFEEAFKTGVFDHIN